jgi:hypothetical protein
MAERVFLHVGTPKSGTTYLQTALWQNVDRLKSDGFLLPGRFRGHYAAAKGITSRRGLKHETITDVESAWPRLAQQINRWSGDAAISHELLSPATREQADAANALLANAEVHIVLTARALQKQLPASWQEQVKGGSATPYDAFVARVRDEDAKTEWFWEVQDLPAIAERWVGDLPAQRVHIVTVPADRPTPTLLWERFTSVFGLDPTSYDSEVVTTNASLGAVESELLRQVHAVQDERFTDRNRHQWTRKLLAIKTLGQRRGESLLLPPGSQAWVDERTAAMVAAIRSAGYDVVGDLADLDWHAPSGQARSIDSVTPDELSEASEWAIARLQEVLVAREASTPPPSVGPEDGVHGILELLEHIRAADSETAPREAVAKAAPAPGRLRKSFTALRGR